MTTTTPAGPDATESGSAPVRVSFEFFPPKTEKMEETLWRSVEKLAPLAPSFVSVTYGAGGSTRERTHATVKRILTETDLVPAAHLTCVDATRDDVNAVARAYADIGVRHIVALRGDPVAGVGTAYTPHPEGYACTPDLITGLKAIADFEISVSAYPEKHPESPDWQTEIDLLKRKVDAGATRAMTQFFFDNDRFEAYLEKMHGAGIFIPIVPGIIPIHNFTQITKFAAACGASIPARIARRFEGLENDPDTHRLVAVAVATEQVDDLVSRGVCEFHFYTLNRAEMVYAICHLLGIKPAQPSIAVA